MQKNIKNKDLIQELNKEKQQEKSKDKKLWTYKKIKWTLINNKENKILTINKYGKMHIKKKWIVIKLIY